MDLSSDRWAVWSAWRGDRAKLARIARAMEASYPEGGAPPARVVVRALGDREEYPSVTRFVDEASSQTTARFESVTFATEGGQGSLEVVVRRKEEPGVVLEVRPDAGGDAWAREARDTVVPAVSRGGLRLPLVGRMPVLRGLVAGAATDDGPDENSRAALERLIRERRAAMRLWTAIVVAAGLGIAYGVGRPVSEDWGDLVWVVPAIVAVAVALSLIPPVRHALQPAVEIAAQTPGRRQLAQLSLFAGPAIAALAKQIF